MSVGEIGNREVVITAYCVESENVESTHHHSAQTLIET